MVFLALFIWCPRKALNYYQLVTQSLGLRLFWRKKCTFHSQGYWSSLGSLKILDTLFVVPFFLVCLLGWPKISQTMVSTKNVSQLFIIIHKSNAWCLNCKNHDFCAFTSLYCWLRLWKMSKQQLTTQFSKMPNKNHGIFPLALNFQKNWVKLAKSLMQKSKYAYVN